MAKKKTASGPKMPRKQLDERNLAFADNPKKKLMEAAGPRKIGGRILKMSEDPKPTKAKRNLMKPVPKRRSMVQKPGTLGDQVASRGVAPEEGPGYIALRVKARGGELEVQAAKFVEGPLLSAEPVSAGLTYEAKIGRRQVAHGDVPDSVEWRSHPDPEGRPGLDGHHVAERTSFDFAVRIPADQIQTKSLEKLRVDLFRWRGKGAGEHLEMRAIRKQPKAAVQKVATLKGVVMKDLSKRLQRDVRKALDRAVR